MKNLLLTLVLSTIGVSAIAQTTLKPAQLNTVCTAVKADTPANTARLAGDTITLLAWLNAAKSPATPAWRVDMSPAESDEAANYTAYDSLAAGKRDSWTLFLGFSRNYSRAKVRNWVTDVWGNATGGSVAEAVLQAATYSATNAQAAVGGTTRTTGTVSALDLTYTGTANAADATWLVQPVNCN